MLVLLGSSSGQTQPPLPSQTNNFMVDFINMKKEDIVWSDVIQVSSTASGELDEIGSVRYCNIDKDGYLIIRVWLQRYDGNWARILFCNAKENEITQSLINNPTSFIETLNKWIVVDYSITHDGWKGCTVQFTGWVKAGQQVAVTCSKAFIVFETYAMLLHY